MPQRRGSTTVPRSASRRSEAQPAVSLGSACTRGRQPRCRLGGWCVCAGPADDNGARPAGPCSGIPRSAEGEWGRPRPGRDPQAGPCTGRPEHDGRSAWERMRETRSHSRPPERARCTPGRSSQRTQRSLFPESFLGTGAGGRFRRGLASSAAGDGLPEGFGSQSSRAPGDVCDLRACRGTCPSRSRPRRPGAGLSVRASVAGLSRAAPFGRPSPALLVRPTKPNNRRRREVWQWSSDARNAASS